MRNIIKWLLILLGFSGCFSIFADSWDLYLTDVDSFRSIQETEDYLFYQDSTRNIKRYNKTTGDNTVFVPNYQGRVRKTYIRDSFLLYDAGSVLWKTYLYKKDFNSTENSSWTGEVFQDLGTAWAFQQMLKETDSAYYYYIGGRLFKKNKLDTGVTGTSIFPVDYGWGWWYWFSVQGNYIIIKTWLNNYYKFDFTNDTYTLLLNNPSGVSFTKANDDLLFMNIGTGVYKWNPSTDISTKQFVLTGSVILSNDTGTGYLFSSWSYRYKSSNWVKTLDWTGSFSPLLNKETFLYNSWSTYLRDISNSMSSWMVLSTDTGISYGWERNLQYQPKWMFPSKYEHSVYYTTGSNLYRIKTPSWIAPPVESFQWLELLEDSKLKKAISIDNSNVLNQDYKDSLLYNTGGIFWNSNIVIVPFEWKSNVSSFLSSKWFGGAQNQKIYSFKVAGRIISIKVEN